MGSLFQRGEILLRDKSSSMGQTRKNKTTTSARAQPGWPGLGTGQRDPRVLAPTREFELPSGCEFATRAPARLAVVAWIEDYNHARRHSALGMKYPADYERSLTGKGRRVTAAGPLRARKGGGCAAAGLTVPAKGTSRPRLKGAA